MVNNNTTTKRNPTYKELNKCSQDIANLITDKLYEFYKDKKCYMPDQIQILVPAISSIIDAQIDASTTVSQEQKQAMKIEAFSFLEYHVAHVCNVIRSK